MPQRKNEVLMEWMDKLCKGEQNRVNVKHILADAEDITVGAVVTARISSRNYTETVLDLLEWSAPRKAKQKRKPAAKVKKQEVSGERGETLDCIILSTVAIYTDDNTYRSKQDRFSS